MWLFPFKTYFLKSPVPRQEIVRIFEDLTFLSDAGYKKRGSEKKYFYGTVSNEDFEFETIAEEQRLTRYFSGFIQGAENEMYITLQVKAFRVRRIYLAFALFVLSCLFIVSLELYHTGLKALGNPPLVLLMAILTGLLAYWIVQCARFWKIQKNSLDFFRGLLQADLVKYKDIPIVFKL